MNSKNRTYHLNHKTVKVKSFSNRTSLNIFNKKIMILFSALSLYLLFSLFNWNSNLKERENQDTSFSKDVEGLIIKNEESITNPSYEETLQRRKQILAEKILAKYNNVKPSFARHVVELAHISGTRYNIDPVLLLAITDVESSYNPNSVSSVGAVGLVQALPRAHPEKFARIRGQGKSPMDAAVNLDMGSQIYSEYRQKFKGNNILALQQYNGSLKDKSLKYSSKVMRAHQNLSDGLPELPLKPLNLIENIE